MKSVYSKVQMGWKTMAVAAGLTVLLALPGQAGDDTFKIARDRSIPGKFGIETCDTFARELYSRLVQAGGEAHYVVYDWQIPGGRSGRHAIVVYRDAQGRYFGMDQSRRQPLWLTGNSPDAWAAWFNGPGYTRVVRSVTDPSLAGAYADLSRAPKAGASSAKLLAMK